MKKIIYLGFCIVVLLLTTASSTPAKLDITASVGLREEYNDNIFLARTNREHDFITTITPSIALKYSPLRSLDLSLDYGLNFRFYSRNSNLNDTSISEMQNIKFQTQIRPLNRVFIDISDVYKRVPIDVRREVAFENVSVNMTDSNIFSISPYVEYPLSPTSLTRFGYRFTNTWYKAKEGDDADSHLAFLTFEKRLSARLTTTLNYDYLAQRPQKTEDYDRHQGSVAVTYQVTPDFQVNGEIGEAKFDYKIRKDTTTTFWNIGTDYRFKIAKGTSLGVSYGTSLRDSTTSGAFKSQRLDLRFKTGKALKLTINPYHSIDKYLETDRKDKITGVALDLSKPLSRKITSSLRGLWERQKFLPENEKVTRYSFGSSFDYKLSRRITTGIGYTYNNKNSNIDTNDFHNNVIWLQARFTF